MNSVQQVKEKDNCCGCGICAAVCPVDAISMQVSGSGKGEPCVTKACVSCGKCLTLCPQNKSGQVWEETAVEQSATAACIACKLTQSKDAEILRNATSGGFVTTLVKSLLQKGEYDGAFLVDGDHYGRLLQTRKVVAGEDLTSTQKSRYVQIGHTQEIAYLLSHREEKLILVGTPCYFRGFMKVLEQYHLNRENYLLVGLFCDKTMTAHVWEYFDQIFADNKLRAMHFRTKQKEGWPGNVALFLEDGTQVDLSRKERMDVKEYFMPECCLDCADKLNRYADFSVGDNYVDGEVGGRGGNSVIIRTSRALAVWDKVESLFAYRESSFEEIAKSQHLYDRERDLKEYRQRREERLRLGAQGHYTDIRAEVLLRRKKNAGLLRRILVKCRRIFERIKKGKR